MRTIPVLYLILPCYNEEEVLGSTIAKVNDKMNRLIKENKIKADSKAMYVNDGSRDNTLSVLLEASHENKMISVVNLSGNYGHQSAILAGMMTARKYADAIITIDADLQQDIEAIDRFLEAYMDGCDVVYGVRNDRSSDGLFKKATATMYYRLMRMLGSEVIPNHADYRLMSKKALDALSEYPETNLFLRGLIPTMGFKSDIVMFDVKKREAGSSKYTLSKMMRLALDGITSFSVKPLHMIMVLGIIIILFGIIMAIISVVDYIAGRNVAGYTTLILVTLITSGTILLSLGVIGEYIGKIYMEAKQRPRYLIDSVVLEADKTDDENN